jgi:RNA polymerase sigma factor (sigma-70 family)
MAIGLKKILDHLHRTLAPVDGGPTDEQLLARFVASRDEASFGMLLRRHGPMVWRLCLRVLGHDQDAEDTFQATFLVLACKAASVLKRESVGSFLYGVAYRTALKAKVIQARRRSRERQVDEMPHPEVVAVEPQDWRPRLDRELNLLPRKYRAVIVACDLEERSRKEAAHHLGLSEGTVSSRLTRGRRLLAKRLSRYGLALSGVVVASALANGATEAHVPASLLSSTTKAAVLVAAGQAALSGSVDFLLKGMLKTMLLAKLKLAIGTVMVVTALGAAGLAYRATSQQPNRTRVDDVLPQTRRAESRPAADDLESLRLEIEALRKELRAMRVRVKALEDEARGGKGRGDVRPRDAEPAPRPRGADTRPPRGEELPPQPRGADTRPTRETPPPTREPSVERGRDTGRLGSRTTEGPIAEAEAALRKLRANPDDKQAAEELERALKRLKAREKPRVPGESGR